MWGAAGASSNLTAAAFKDAPAPVIEVEFPHIDKETVAKARAPLKQQVIQLQQRFPEILSYQSRSSANLQLNASLLRQTFDDDDLKAFSPLCARIVWADLSNTAITDHSARFLADCKQLRTLRLANTQVSEKTLQALTSLDSLQSLSVAGTRLTKSNLTPLHNKGVRIYFGNRTSSKSNAT